MYIKFAPFSNNVEHTMCNKIKTDAFLKMSHISWKMQNSSLSHRDGKFTSNSEKRGHLTLLLVAFSVNAFLNFSINLQLVAHH